MTDIKLAKLAPRTPVKLTLLLTPDLHDALGRYADFYREAYGQEEGLAELVPAMLSAFLASDRAFARFGTKRPGGTARDPEPKPASQTAARSG